MTAACLLDWNLSNAATAATSKSGYYFGLGSTSAGVPYTSYTVGGAPASFNQSGVRGFCSNEDGVIHYNADWNTAPETTWATAPAPHGHRCNSLNLAKYLGEGTSRGATEKSVAPLTF